jgi:hypothetical protein
MVICFSSNAGEAGGQLYPIRTGQGGYTPLQKTPGGIIVIFMSIIFRTGFPLQKTSVEIIVTHSGGIHAHN